MKEDVEHSHRLLVNEGKEKIFQMEKVYQVTLQLNAYFSEGNCVCRDSHVHSAQ